MNKVTRLRDLFLEVISNDNGEHKTKHFLDEMCQFILNNYELSFPDNSKSQLFWKHVTKDHPLVFSNYLDKITNWDLDIEYYPLYLFRMLLWNPGIYDKKMLDLISGGMVISQIDESPFSKLTKKMAQSGVLLTNAPERSHTNICYSRNGKWFIYCPTHDLVQNLTAMGATFNYYNDVTEREDVLQLHELSDDLKITIRLMLSDAFIGNL